MEVSRTNNRLNRFFLFPRPTAILHIALYLIATLAGGYSNAADLVNPDDIETESYHMLNPRAFYSNCAKKRFEIALEMPEDSVGARISSFPVPYNGGQEAVKCILNGHTIEAKVSISGTGSGMCGAVNSISTTISVDSKKILNSDFANYCTTWGLSGFRIESYETDKLIKFVVCGYWPTREKVGTNEIESNTYACTSYAAQDILKNNLIIRRGERYLTPDS